MDEFVLNSTDDSEVCRLLAEARHESNSGLGRLLEAFRPALLELAEQSLGDPIRRRVSVSDLVQDTMLTACGQFAAFRGNSAPELRDWLYLVFHSRLVDGFRRHEVAERRRQTQEDHHVDTSAIADSQLSPSGVAANRDDAEQLLLILQQLPLEAQTLIRMRYLENLSFESISEKTGIAMTTVWRRFQEAVQVLHDRLPHGKM